MPVLSRFQSGSGTSGVPLPSVTGITTQPASGKVYIKWTDPEDVTFDEATLATWAGTLLVRKAGSSPIGRRDGVQVLDSKTRNAYKNTWFVDSGLSNGTTYYYKFFPYTTDGVFTDDTADQFSATPVATAPGNVSGITLTAAGNGKLGIKWTDPAATITTNGVVVSTWASTKVVVKAGSYATSPNDANAVFAYTETTRNAYSNTALIATGLTNGTTYYVSFFPTATDGAVNTSTANRKTGVADRISLVVVPSQNSTGTNKLIYTGESQNPVWNNYDSNALTGVWVAQTNAGTYTASFTPKADYKWAASLLEDGEDPTGTKNVSWKIWQAPGTLSTDKASVTLYGSQETVDVTISGTYDGTLSVESSDTSVAVVTLSGNVATIRSTRKAGSIVVTVSATGGVNYTDQTINILVDVLFTLEETPWSVISEISAAGLGSNYWEVGDTKSVTLNGTVGQYTFSSYTAYAFIIGFNHNSGYEGGNRIHFQFGKTALSGGTDICFIDGSYGSSVTTAAFHMNNNSNTNSGGWNSSYMRNTICGASLSSYSGTFIAALPSDLRSVLKTVTKYTDNTGGGSGTASYVTATTDVIFLLSEWEVFGARKYANSAEKNYQAQYAYYAAGNSKIKYQHTSTGSAARWWLRSPRSSYYGHFVNVNTDGTVNGNYANDSFGFAPGFCV